MINGGVCLMKSLLTSPYLLLLLLSLFQTDDFIEMASYMMAESKNNCVSLQH